MNDEWRPKWLRPGPKWFALNVALVVYACAVHHKPLWFIAADVIPTSAIYAGVIYFRSRSGKR